MERCQAFVAGTLYGARWFLRFLYRSTGECPHEDERTFVVRSPLGAKVPTMAPPGYWAVLQAIRSMLAWMALFPSGGVTWPCPQSCGRFGITLRHCTRT